MAAIGRSSEKTSRTALLDMKRGIAIDVAASVYILLVALLVYFTIERRKTIKACPTPQN